MIYHVAPDFNSPVQYRLILAKRPRFHAFAISRDDQYLYWMAQIGSLELYEINASDGAILASVEQPSINLRQNSQIYASPDSTKIYFNADDAGKGLLCRWFRSTPSTFDCFNYNTDKMFEIVVPVDGTKVMVGETGTGNGNLNFYMTDFTGTPTGLWKSTMSCPSPGN